jgi:integrase
MPQVFKREWKGNDGTAKTSKVYYARFQVNGKDVIRSTGKAKKGEAVHEMQRMVAEARGGTATDDLLNRLKRAIDDLPEEEQSERRQQVIRELQRGVGHKLALDEVWQAWEDNPNKGNPGASTLSGYKGQWKRFSKWAKKNGIEYLHETTPALAERYAADLWKSKMAPRTYNSHINFLKGLFRTLKLTASIIENPFEHLRQKEAATESKRNFTPDELKTICSRAEGSMRYLIALGLYTGMRMGDCACLAWEAVDFENGLITHIPMKTSRKGKQVRIPIHPVLESLLEELRQTSRGKYLFPEERKSYLHDGSLLSRRIKRFLKTTCEIETQDKETTGQRKNVVCRVGFHSLRHSFVSLCAANRVPQVAIMELVGHGSPAMTALYSHAGDEQKAKAITALPSVSFESEQRDESEE